MSRGWNGGYEISSSVTEGLKKVCIRIYGFEFNLGPTNAMEKFPYDYDDSEVK